MANSQRKWTYDFYRLVPLDHLQLVCHPTAGDDQIVTFEWSRAHVEANKPVQPGEEGMLESITVTTIASSSASSDDHGNAVSSFSVVTSAAAAMANSAGAVPDRDNMASFANKINRAITDCCEKGAARSGGGTLSLAAPAPPPLD